MSLWIAILERESGILASDARIWCEIPNRGIEVYDCAKKIKRLGDKLWMVESGIGVGTSFIYNKLKNEKIRKIEDLQKVSKDFFCQIHKELLDGYKVKYNNRNDLYTGINLLFAGINSEKLPIFCCVSSENSYQQIYFSSPYSYIFSKTGLQEIDNLIKEKIEIIINKLKRVTPVQICCIKEITKELSLLYSEAGDKNWGIGFLSDFLWFKKEGYYFRKFHIFERCVDYLRLKLDMFSYGLLKNQ
jgi:hypothetical protein